MLTSSLSEHEITDVGGRVGVAVDADGSVRSTNGADRGGHLAGAESA
jgi:hypothetical protein